MAWNATVVNVLEADGAVGPADVLHASMAFGFELHRQTHIAHLAVEEAILATDAADAA